MGKQFLVNMICQDEPPQETKNTNSPPSLPPLNLQPHSFSSLPDEIAENILACVSKRYYPNLSLVSKRFLSLLSSPELYRTRSRIGTTEPCIYIFLEYSILDPRSRRLFTLRLKPADETLTEDDDLPYDDYTLVPIPVPSPKPFMHFPSIVAVGSEIYLIGGDRYGLSSSAVRILDCRSHTWRDGPSMLVARKSPRVVFLDEKIYVMDGCEKEDTWMEVLDIKTKTWSPLMRHVATGLENKWIKTMLVVEGKIYAIVDLNYYAAYDPKEGTWEVVETHHNFRNIYFWCVIEDVMYCYINTGYFIWYDSKSKKWMHVMGSDMELLRNDITYNLARGSVLEIVNDGGKLLVLSVPNSEIGQRNSRIWYTKIALEKRHGNEVWGKIETPSTVITVSESYSRSKCVVVSI